MHINIDSAICVTSMKSAYKYRAYPSKEEIEILNRQMFSSKELYVVFQDDKSKTPLEARVFRRGRKPLAKVIMFF